jgi:hypothetical protein
VDYRSGVLAAPFQNGFLGEQLAAEVQVLVSAPPWRRGLVADLPRSGRTNQAGRADVDHFRHVVPRGGVQQIAGAIHIGAVQQVPMVARCVVFAKIGGGVDQEIATGQLRGETVDGGDVPLDHRHIAGYVKAGGLGGIARQRSHRVAGGQQNVHDVTA